MRTRKEIEKMNWENKKRIEDVLTNIINSDSDHTENTFKNHCNLIENEFPVNTYSKTEVEKNNLRKIVYSFNDTNGMQLEMFVSKTENNELYYNLYLSSAFIEISKIDVLESINLKETSKLIELVDLYLSQYGYNLGKTWLNKNEYLEIEEITENEEDFLAFGPHEGLVLTNISNNEKIEITEYNKQKYKDYIIKNYDFLDFIKGYIQKNADLTLLDDCKKVMENMKNLDSKNILQITKTLDEYGYLDEWSQPFVRKLLNCVITKVINESDFGNIDINNFLYSFLCRKEFMNNNDYNNKLDEIKNKLFNTSTKLKHKFYYVNYENDFSKIPMMQFYYHLNLNSSYNIVKNEFKVFNYNEKKYTSELAYKRLNMEYVEPEKNYFTRYLFFKDFVCSMTKKREYMKNYSNNKSILYRKNDLFILYNVVPQGLFHAFFPGLKVFFNAFSDFLPYNFQMEKYQQRVTDTYDNDIYTDLDKFQSCLEEINNDKFKVESINFISKYAEEKLNKFFEMKKDHLFDNLSEKEILKRKNETEKIVEKIKKSISWFNSKKEKDRRNNEIEKLEVEIEKINSDLKLINSSQIEKDFFNFITNKDKKNLFQEESFFAMQYSINPNLVSKTVNLNYTREFVTIFKNIGYYSNLENEHNEIFKGIIPRLDDERFYFVAYDKNDEYDKETEYFKKEYPLELLEILYLKDNLHYIGEFYENLIIKNVIYPYVETFSDKYPTYIQLRVGDEQEERCVFNVDTGKIYSNQISEEYQRLLDGNFNIDNVDNVQKDYKSGDYLFSKIFEIAKNTETNKEYFDQLKLFLEKEDKEYERYGFKKVVEEEKIEEDKEK